MFDNCDKSFTSTRSIEIHNLFFSPIEKLDPILYLNRTGILK